MAGEEFHVQAMRFLQFWGNWIMIEVWRRCLAFVFSASADTREQVEDRLHCIPRGSSDGGTASPLDATSSGEGEWEEITTALTASSAHELQISINIDLAGEFKVPLGLADEASQPAHAAATGSSAQCQIVPQRRSLEDSKDHDIITAQRTPKPAVQDVKIEKEVWVMNTRFVTSVNIKPDQIEFLTQDHVCIGVDALFEDRFREFGKPELDNTEAGGLLVLEAKPFKGPGHVPLFVSEGSMPTFAIHVDKTMTKLVPSLENCRTAAELEDHAEESLPLKNDGNGSLGSSSSFM